MKTQLTILFLFANAFTYAQYYIRGEVRDETGKAVFNAKIKLHSNSFIYTSGSSGGFGIPTTCESDSLTVSADGYLPVSMRVQSTSYVTVIMKPLPGTVVLQQRPKLVSITKDLPFSNKKRWTVGEETYSSLIENDFITAESFPETGFALNIDKAAYSNIRRFLNMNSKVPPDAVRIEELLNYFNFGYQEPEKDSLFHIRSTLTGCPWNKHHQLLMLNLSARKVDMSQLPPSNLVFLIDVSGSMDMPNRLPLLKSSFQLLVDNLRPIDTVTIVVYGSTVGIWLQPTSGGEKLKIRKAIEELEPAGSTPGASGILMAYQMAKRQFIPGGNNRVIIATDGDFNVGQTSDKELEDLIIQNRLSGIYLTCLGVGMGNYKDSKLEMLAKKGDGNFAYLDSEKEAEKVLVKELTQTMYAVANDAFLFINFNSDPVKEYRLIGFDNKLNAANDSTSVLEGGEVGSGYSLTAMFELKLASASSSPYLADVVVNYKLPDDTLQRYSSYKVSSNHTSFAQLDNCQRFATSLVMFGLKLKQSKYIPDMPWNDILSVASSGLNKSDALQIEFIQMIERARKIYGNKRRKSKK
ncbi:MAG TPA: von Willebrand factor type A domain-containing protein [Parasegetibacter sp.]